MTTQLTGNKCDGGHYTCSPPKECCYKGCCFLLAPSVYPIKPPSIQVGHVFNPLFLGHWYFWLAVTATVAGILCACSLWRKHSQGAFCCRDTARDERASEPDSNGSCYLPPQYSRCNSFHQPPPPYSEVASKPDLYPLVINYNTDPVIKNNSTPTGYLMVQYFRNFIVRPVGSISAASTNDSISSSFLCNATNEANNIVPPPYSNVGSLEEVTSSIPAQPSPTPSNTSRIPRSASTISNATTEYHQVPIQRSPSEQTQINPQLVTTACKISPLRTNALHTPTVIQIRNNPCFPGQSAINRNIILVPNSQETKTDNKISHISRKLPSRNQNIRKEQSQESTEDEDHNFSDLLNLSVCVPNSNVVLLENPIHANPHLQELQQQYCVTNSMTGSDISSLANLGTPDSPPRATSPTSEMKELLDKIQQLPNQKSPVPHNSQTQQPIDGVAPKGSRNYYHKVRAKTLYMPLCNESPSASPTAKTIPNIFSRNWLSRSAPCTPSGSFVPNFPSSRSNSKSKLKDSSPLLKEHAEESEDDHINNRDEAL